MKRSKHLNAFQASGLARLGRVVAPGDSRIPSFNEGEFSAHADRVLDGLPEDDRFGLLLLLGAFAFIPDFILANLLKIIEKLAVVHGLRGAPFRMLEMGLKGVVFSLYYSDIGASGGNILKELNYQTSIKMDQGDIMLQEAQNNEPISNPGPERIQEIFNKSKGVQRELGNLSVKTRVNYISSLREVILEDMDSIIDAIQKDTGKSQTDALISEVFSALDYLEFLEKVSANALKDQKIKTPIALLGKKSKVFYESLGTLLVISPWNYPFYQAIVPIATSFVCGNGTIYKPSEFTPLKGLIEGLLNKAGFRKNWAQVVYGDGKTGAALIESRPDKIFFTGSVATGKKIMKAASELLIPVELELGGKDAAVIFDDVNIPRTAAGVAWGALTNLGQSCTSVERIYVHEEIYDSFKKELVKVVSGLKQEVDSDGDADVGAMTTEGQIKIVKEHFEDAKEKGASFLTGGQWDGESKMIPPMVIENISPEMKLFEEETFGPMLPLVKFHDETSVVEEINESKFGLSASVWSKDLSRANRVARQLNVGNVSINNVMLTEGNPYLPFGGNKYSGIGRYKGIAGIRAFAQSKSVIIDKDSAKIEVNWYPYTSKKFKLFKDLTKNAFTHGLKAFIKFAVTGLKIENYSDKAGKKGRIDLK